MGNGVSIEAEASKKKCSLCKNTLSVPPIILLSDDGTESKCGRCENVPNKSKGRNSDLEDLAKMLSFPCIYEGCTMKIVWNEVSKHEEECLERTIICPIFTFPSCKTVVRVRNLEEHMKMEHPSSLYQDHFTVTLSSIRDSIPYVLIHKNEAFLMIFRKLNTSLFLYVVSLNNDKCSNYDLKLIKNRINSNDFCILYENQPITKYTERNHCFHCINKNCDLIYHPHSENYKNVPMNINWKLINLIYVQQILGNISDISVSMEISDLERKINHNTQAPMDDPINSTNQYRNQDALRNTLQCPICMEYMIRSIYNCEKGHTICQECREKLTKCPYCPAPLRDSRNFALENLAGDAVLTCIFNRSGCGVTGKVVWLSKHEKNCDYKDIENGEGTKK